MKTPDEAQLKVLRNLAHGRDFLEGFIVQANAVRAMFGCLVEGWVDRGRLTEEGTAVLAVFEAEAEAEAPGGAQQSK